MSAAKERQVPISAITLGLLLAFAGLVISGYLTLEHFDTSVTLACPDTGTISCQKVTTSQYSLLLGIPVAVLGTLYYLLGLVLLLPAAWRSPDLRLSRARLAWAASGALMVVYLIWAELYGANAICLWCTSVHTITLALYTLVAFTEAWVLPVRGAPLR